MKDPSLLTLLIHIIKNHFADNGELDTPRDAILLDLEEQGFRRRLVSDALDWLGGLVANRYQFSQSSGQFTRIFSQEEQSLLGSDGCNYLLSLEKMHILNVVTKELVIDRVMALQDEGIDLHLIQWVTLVVLYSCPKQAHALKRMELLVYDEFEEIH